jgi:hypothetical protein
MLKGMAYESTPLPNPDAERVTQWLGSQTVGELHNETWIEVNKRFHGIAMAARRYANERIENPAQKAAFFDGLTLGLAALAREVDIQELEARFSSAEDNGANPGRIASGEYAGA